MLNQHHTGEFEYIYISAHHLILLQIYILSIFIAYGKNAIQGLTNVQTCHSLYFFINISKATGSKCDIQSLHVCSICMWSGQGAQVCPIHIAMLFIDLSISVAVVFPEFMQWYGTMGWCIIWSSPQLEMLWCPWHQSISSCGDDPIIIHNHSWNHHLLLTIHHILMQLLLWVTAVTD